MFSLAASKLLGVGKTIAVMAGLSGLAVIGPLQLDPGAPADMRTVALSGGTRLSVARYEVTWNDWQRCAGAGACAHLPKPRLGKAPVPATGVNAFDAGAYIAWRNAGTGHRYRLPTAEEWRAIAIDLPRKPARKLFDDPRLAWAASYGSMEQVSAVVRPSGQFGTFANGISDLAGNVWEWTSTCAAPGMDAATCPAYLVEGLHETALSVFVRDPASGGCAVGAPPANIGFRLVEDLEGSGTARLP